jgi:Peptidase A4 family
MRRSMHAVAAAVVMLSGFGTFAAAQSEAARAIYDSSAALPTNMAGIRTFSAPPANFNALTASEEALATYGFPPRPDKNTDPSGFAKWTKAMATPTKRWNGELKPRHFQNMPMKEAKAPAGVKLTPSVGHTASTGLSFNWSGVVNTNTLTRYNPKSSFYYIFSEFNVPVAQQAFNGSGGNICDGGWDIASIWNGIDGFGSGDVLQGGVDSAYYCNGSTKSPFYETWIEWYPAGSVYEYAVNPGDDMYVETWNTSSTQGYVWIEDLTRQISAVYGLTAPSGTQLIGNSAEFVVERPCCITAPNGAVVNYPLTNYIANFWDYSGDYNFHNTLGYPGSTSPSTWLLSMVDDADDQVISVPNGITPEDVSQGLTGAGLGGKFSIFFQDENCAYLGGCVE